jgi:hypothetical protein
MATKEALGAGFKPGEATIDADSLCGRNAYPLHHALHQLGAMELPNKRRLTTARSAHYKSPSRKAPSEPSDYYTSNNPTKTPGEVSRPMRPTEARTNAAVEPLALTMLSPMLIQVNDRSVGRWCKLLCPYGQIRLGAECHMTLQGREI